MGGLPQTAHHIIPQNLLKAALKLLNREQKQELYWRAGVPWVRKDQNREFLQNRIMWSYVNQYNETERGLSRSGRGESFLWAKYNDTGRNRGKEGFDYDARYMGVMDQKKDLIG